MCNDLRCDLHPVRPEVGVVPVALSSFQPSATCTPSSPLANRHLTGRAFEDERLLFFTHGAKDKGNTKARVVFSTLRRDSRASESVRRLHVAHFAEFRERIRQ